MPFACFPRPVIAQRVQVCKVPEGVLYLKHSTCIHVPLKQSPRRPLVQPGHACNHTTMYSNLACTIPCPPCCLHTRPAGAARFAFAGLAHVLPTRPPCPAARVGLAGLKRLCRASALAAGPSVRVSITSPATAADCVFPLASGNVFWRRHNRPGKYTHRQ